MDHHIESTAPNLIIQTDPTKQSTSSTQPAPTRGRPKGSTNAAIAAAAAAAAAAASTGSTTSIPVISTNKSPTNVTPLVSQQATSPSLKHQRKMNPPKVKDDKSSKSGSSKSSKSPNDKSGPSLNVRVRRLDLKRCWRKCFFLFFKSFFLLLLLLSVVHVVCSTSSFP